jgi:hypothetical protein
MYKVNENCTKVKILTSLNFQKFLVDQVATSIPTCRVITRSL